MPILKRCVNFCLAGLAGLNIACSCLPGLLLLASPAQAAQETLINIGPDVIQGLAPGMMLVLPDGRRAAIQEELPDGNFRTDVDVVVSPSGVIVEGPLKGEQVVLPKNVVLPEKPDQATRPLEPKQEEPVKKAEIAKEEKADQEKAAQAIQKTPDAKKDEQLTIVELLPMTKVPEAKTQPEKPAQKPVQKEPEKKAPEKKQAEKKQPEKKPEQAKPKKEPPAKSKPGQELHIPPEAAKTGNLAFLEGCWQGTRPEYFSKRTIRECFCFGANGKNGKRRVYDPQGHRMCIGSSQARLSQDGTLSVTSSGAACNDGQRWGQAEMVCRNSGPKTPCSWVFRDAQNGRQSYQIPFVRVESCGR